MAQQWDKRQNEKYKLKREAGSNRRQGQEDGLKGVEADKPVLFKRLRHKKHDCRYEREVRERARDVVADAAGRPQHRLSSIPTTTWTESSVVGHLNPTSGARKRHGFAPKLISGAVVIEKASHYSSGGVLLAAVLANPINLESMTSGEIVVLAADFLLQAIHFGREEFH